MDHSARVPPPPLVGLALFPFGLVVGFTITALPFLLTNLHIPLDRVAGVSATVMSPTFWGFLLQPLMDTGLTRRAYSWLTASVAAVCLCLGLVLLSPVHLGLATALLLIAELSIVLFSGALSGWIAEFTPDSRRGSVSGWMNVANLGGGALGSLAVMSLVPHVPVWWLGLGLAVMIVAGTSPTILFPPPRRSSFSFRQIFTHALKATWRVSKTTECLTGFALFLAPVSAGALINLFSGLGKDFHSGEHLVIWITGAGCAATASIGSLIGGHAANRVSRGYLYVFAGMSIGVCGLVLAFTPHNPVAFAAGALVYNGITGICYAAFNALGYQLVGEKTEVASTQLGLFSASTNFAIVYMTWLDGQGYRYFGLNGLLLVDALASLVTGTVILVFLGRLLRRRPGRVTELLPNSR